MLSFRSVKAALGIVAVACLLSFAGCGPSYSYVPVSGTVSINGKPTADIEVTFYPIVEKQDESKPASFGKTDASGKFTLTARGGEPGAVPGEHRIEFRFVGGVSEEQIGEAESELVEAQSGEDKAEISAAKKRLDDLKKQQKGSVIPKKYQGGEGNVKFTVPDGGTDAADFKL